MPAPTSVTGVWAKVALIGKMLREVIARTIKNGAFVGIVLFVVIVLIVFIAVIDIVLHGFEDFKKGLVPVLLELFQDHFLFALFRGIAEIFGFADFQGINLRVVSKADKHFLEFPVCRKVFVDGKYLFFLEFGEANCITDALELIPEFAHVKQDPCISIVDNRISNHR